jgi:hypothetical protein
VDNKELGCPPHFVQFVGFAPDFLEGIFLEDFNKAEIMWKNLNF